MESQQQDINDDVEQQQQLDGAAGHEDFHDAHETADNTTGNTATETDELPSQPAQEAPSANVAEDAVLPGTSSEDAKQAEAAADADPEDDSPRTHSTQSVSADGDTEFDLDATPLMKMSAGDAQTEDGADSKTVNSNIIRHVERDIDLLEAQAANMSKSSVVAGDNRVEIQTGGSEAASTVSGMSGPSRSRSHSVASASASAASASMKRKTLLAPNRPSQYSSRTSMPGGGTRPTGSMAIMANLDSSLKDMIYDETSGGGRMYRYSSPEILKGAGGGYNSLEEDSDEENLKNNTPRGGAYTMSETYVNFFMVLFVFALFFFALYLNRYYIRVASNPHQGPLPNAFGGATVPPHADAIAPGAGTMTARQHRIQQLQSLILRRGVSTPDSFPQDFSGDFLQDERNDHMIDKLSPTLLTPQTKALLWLAGQSIDTEIPEDDDIVHDALQWTLLERYALATLYFATSNDNSEDFLVVGPSTAATVTAVAKDGYHTADAIQIKTLKTKESYSGGGYHSADAIQVKRGPSKDWHTPDAIHVKTAAESMQVKTLLGKDGHTSDAINVKTIGKDGHFADSINLKSVNEKYHSADAVNVKSFSKSYHRADAINIKNLNNDAARALASVPAYVKDSGTDFGRAVAAGNSTILAHHTSYNSTRPAQVIPVTVTKGDDDNGKGSWIQHKNWLSKESVCTWYGVGCEEDEQRYTYIVALNLTRNGLQGVLPALELYQVLQRHLQRLDLSHNQIQGTTDLPINTQSYVVQGQQGVDAWSKLQQFILQNNSLRGSLPVHWFTAQPSQIVMINVANNLFEGTVPEFAFDRFYKLRQLLMGGNRLVGHLPRVSMVPELYSVDFSANMFSGTIPADASIFAIPKLAELRLGGNNLKGIIPQSLTMASNLEVLSLERNEFTGLPNDLQRLSNLTTLLLNDNHIAGLLPHFSVLRKLENLTAHDNHFTGEIPESLGQLSKIRSLTLYNNRMVGVVNPELCKLKAGLFHRPQLQFLAADCLEQVHCDCCDQCY